jgi:hypothetical protein
MERRIAIAHYASSMTRELGRMCREAELDDLAYLLEVAAIEAARVGSTHDARPCATVHTLSLQAG